MSLDKEYDAFVSKFANNFKEKAVGDIKQLLNDLIDRIDMKFSDEIRSSVLQISSGDEHNNPSRIYDTPSVAFAKSHINVVRNGRVTNIGVYQKYRGGLHTTADGFANYLRFIERFEQERDNDETWIIAGVEQYATYNYFLIFVSNNCKVVLFDYSSYHRDAEFIHYHNRALKTPVDYANLIVNMVGFVDYGGTALVECARTPTPPKETIMGLFKTETFPSSGTIIERIFDTIDYIYYEQYHRKTIPPYVRPIIAENEKLKHCNEELRRRNEELRRRINELGPIEDLERRQANLRMQQAKLNEARENLRKFSVKLELEKREFDKLRLINIEDGESIVADSCYLCLEITTDRSKCGHPIHDECLKKLKYKCPICD